MGEKTEGFEKLGSRELLIRKKIVALFTGLHLTPLHDWLFVIVWFVII